MLTRGRYDVVTWMPPPAFPHRPYLGFPVHELEDLVGSPNGSSECGEHISHGLESAAERLLVQHEGDEAARRHLALQHQGPTIKKHSRRQCRRKERVYHRVS